MQANIRKPRRRTRKVTVIAQTNEPRIIMPWDTSRWPVIRAACERVVESSVDFEAMINTVRITRVKPRTCSQTCEDLRQMDKPPVTSEQLYRAIAIAQAYILDGPDLFHKHSMRVCDNGNVTFTTRQTACIVAMMWFGLFEYDYVRDVEMFSEPNLPVDNLFLLCSIVCYFTAPRPDGMIIVKRTRAVPPNWQECETVICEPLLGELGAHHDDSYAPAIWVSAHDYLGGDLFTGAITQEEIMLACRPDALICILICPRLRDDVVTVFGARKYSQYAGIGSSLRCVQSYNDPTGGAPLARTCLIFADACKKTSTETQMGEFDRDLNKALCGFASFPHATVACGTWSYGTLPTNHEVKFIQMLLAASVYGCTIEYYPLGRDFEEYVEPFMAWLHAEKITVGEMYELYYDCLDYIEATNMRTGDIRLMEMFMDA